MLEWINANLAYVILGGMSFLLLILIMIILFHKDKKVVNNKPTAKETLDLMQKDLDTKEVDQVTKYEDDQEEKAIISYKELVKAKEETERKENKSFNSVDEYFDYLNNSSKEEVKPMIEPVLEQKKEVSYHKEEDFLQSLKDFRKSL